MIADNKPKPKEKNLKTERLLTREEVKNLKGRVYKAEQANTEYINAYQYKKDWWQIGGVSALHYFYDLSRINGHKTVSKKEDRDWYYIWKSGVIAFNSWENLKNKMTRAGLEKMEKVEESWVRFKLEKPLSEENIKRLFETDEKIKNAANEIIMPKNNYPKFYAELRELSRNITETLRKLDAPMRELYGIDAARSLEKAKIKFILMANGHISKEKYFSSIIQELDYVSAWLMATSDYRIFDVKALARHARNLLNLRNQAEDILKAKNE